MCVHVHACMLRPPHKSKVFLLRSLTRRLTNDTIGRTSNHDRCRRDLSFGLETSDWWKSMNEREKKERDGEAFILLSSDRDETRISEAMLASSASVEMQNAYYHVPERECLVRPRPLCMSGILDSNRFLSSKSSLSLALFLVYLTRELQMDSDSVPTVSMDTPDNHKHTLSHDIGDQPLLKRNSSKVPVTLHIRYKTNTFPIECDLYDTLKDLKEKIDKLTDVDPQVQKLVNKSITSVKRDDATTTLKDLNITDGQTLLLVGATRTDILSTTGASVQTAGSKDATDTQASTGTKKEPLCKQTKHEKVLKTGKIGTTGRRETPLRLHSLSVL